MEIDLRLNLPRDQLTVPVVRHLCTSTLRELGVAQTCRDDVELALTEACANVVAHSGPGDAYDVEITIGEEAVAIRVLDTGHGFDQANLLDLGDSDATAESGRGINLMRALVDRVRLESKPQAGTVVHLEKRLEFDGDTPARTLLEQSTTPGS